MKGKGFVFSVYKKKKLGCPWCIQSENAKNILWLMHFQVKMLESPGWSIFRDKPTKKNLPLMFFDIKMVTEA